MLRLLVIALLLMPISAYAQAPKVAQHYHNGDWMLILRQQDTCQHAPSSTPKIALGLSRVECVQALYIEGAAHNPSDTKFEYPDTGCDKMGVKTNFGINAGCAYPKGYWENHSSVLSLNSETLMCPVWETTGTCTNVETGIQRSDLAIDKWEAYP